VTTAIHDLHDDVASKLAGHDRLVRVTDDRTDAERLTRDRRVEL
jgi:hypothetical protein